MRTQDHIVDSIVLGGIVTVRDRLLEQQARGEKVYRLESGDPSFAVPDHVREAIKRALDEGHTHYSPGAGIKPRSWAEGLLSVRQMGLKVVHFDFERNLMSWKK